MCEEMPCDHVSPLATGNSPAAIKWRFDVKKQEVLQLMRQHDRAETGSIREPAKTTEVRKI